ncbi:hypothetical protein [Acanthopleuribacter pedis]|uniref:DUF883 domain-containing protein n=1 Tax=Acanthopleuribacter pedis TaxID=442870 RepID=A0A8J7Q1I2_9BACT|nr:hypothetical protein [Acanthopleuribacter pedis]MBO1317520.1 hypothetical protein [Acanthopleuribacter pedis]
MTPQAQLQESNNVSNFTQKEKELSPAKEVENIREDMKVLREDLASLTQVITELGAREVNRVKENVMDTSKEMIESSTEVTKKSLNRVENSIKERPFVYVGSAFGLGILASAFLKRK